MDKIKIAKSKFTQASQYTNGTDVYGVNLIPEGLLALTEAIEEAQRPAKRAAAKRRTK